MRLTDFAAVKILTYTLTTWQPFWAEETGTIYPVKWSVAVGECSHTNHIFHMYGSTD